MKEYTGSVYVAVVGTQEENGECRDSIEKIILQEGDERAAFIRATKGYEARQMHINKWYQENKHPFILLLDSDMVFPPHTLERLRAHKKPFVSGFYMRRRVNPPLPVWYERGEAGVMPMRPMLAIPEKDTWYPIGASGWGCMLLHRDVVTAVKPFLKGEPEIIEDDMDIYPYDLKEILGAIRGLHKATKERAVLDTVTIRPFVDALIQEIRPLRGDKSDVVGSDIRFPFFARLAGFELIGDTGVLCGHAVPYYVGIDDWLVQPAHVVRDVSKYVNKEQGKERELMKGAIL